MIRDLFHTRNGWFALWVACATVMIFVLAGCQQVEGNQQAPVAVNVGGDVLPIVTDPDTGCQYIGYTGHGLTPRLDRDGKPMCGARQ